MFFFQSCYFYGWLHSTTATGPDTHSRLAAEVLHVASRALDALHFFLLLQFCFRSLAFNWWRLKPSDLLLCTSLDPDLDLDLIKEEGSAARATQFTCVHRVLFGHQRYWRRRCPACTRAPSAFGAGAMARWGWFAVGPEISPVGSSTHFWVAKAANGPSSSVGPNFLFFLWSWDEYQCGAQFW